jgi:beta-glucanase (GH16 family)
MRRARVGVAMFAVAALLAAAVLAWAGTPPRRADPSHADSSHAHGKLVFNAEFNGSRLDRRDWSTCFWWGERGCTIATNDELEWYQPGQVTVASGSAHLIAAHEAVMASDHHTYPFASGMISSGPAPGRRRAKFAFRYGRVEARIRVPTGQGLWPGFWLLPANRTSLPEIDVMEYVSRQPDELELHLHYHGGVYGTVRRLRPGPGHWHIYGINWRPGRLTWLVDGHVLYRVTGAAVPSVPMYLIANLAVGGVGPGSPSATTRFPTAVKIDWVRVWK